MKVLICLATRPEVMKNYSIVKELKSRSIDVVVVHTNQHRDYSMNKVFFEEMGYSADYILKGQYKMGKAIDYVIDVIKSEKPDWILVNGDTAGALVGALAGQYTDTKICHVEAGLRSFDKDMYEERNRMSVDGMAHLLLTYTKKQADYLKNNKELRGKIKFVGNTTVDLIHDFDSEIRAASVLGHGINNYFYVTLHRKEFTDSKVRMIRVFGVLRRISEKHDIHMIFPVHPRTRDCAKRYDIDIEALCGDKVHCIKPVSAFESLRYEMKAKMILTDSGCIQEEACVFGVPCITIRDNTERHECVEAGINIVTGFKPTDIINAVEDFLEEPPEKFPKLYGTYGVGRRIVDSLITNLDK